MKYATAHKITKESSPVAEKIKELSMNSKLVLFGRVISLDSHKALKKLFGMIKVGQPIDVEQMLEERGFELGKKDIGF
ncbi:MAG: hypothetical protein AB1414_17850 [bacterium]